MPWTRHEQQQQKQPIPMCMIFMDYPRVLCDKQLCNNILCCVFHLEQLLLHTVSDFLLTTAFQYTFQ